MLGCPAGGGSRTIPFCMVRLPFASENERERRSFVSGLLIDTRVVALMDIRSRLWSHFRQDPLRDQKGHLTLGAPLRPLVPVLSCEVQ